MCDNASQDSDVGTQVTDGACSGGCAKTHTCCAKEDPRVDTKKEEEIQFLPEGCGELLHQWEPSEKEPLYPHSVVVKNGKKYIILRAKEASTAHSDTARTLAARVLAKAGISCYSMTQSRAPFAVDMLTGDPELVVDADGNYAGSRTIPENRRVYEIWFRIENPDDI